MKDMPKGQWLQAIEVKPGQVIIEGAASEIFMQKVCLKLLQDLPNHLITPILTAFKEQQND